MYNTKLKTNGLVNQFVVSKINIHTNNGGFMNKSTKLYQWLFTEDERAPIGFIPTFFMTILISAGICWFMTGVMGMH